MHAEVVELVTDVVPPPVADTVGVKEPPKVAEAGRLVMVGVVGVALAMVKLWADPSAAE